MNRKSVLFISIILISGTVLLTGCGGGGGGSVPIEKGPSTDYLGLQVGAKLIYKVIDDSGNISTNTYEVVEVDTSEVYKTKSTSTDDPGDSWGSFIRKGADGVYYQTAEWDWDQHFNKEKRKPYELEKTVIVNPVYLGFESDKWGKAIRQEVVTIPIGTFKAWLFHKMEIDENGTSITLDFYSWFVPNLGTIKLFFREINNDNNKIFYSATTILESYSF